VQQPDKLKFERGCKENEKDTQELLKKDIEISGTFV